MIKLNNKHLFWLPLFLLFVACDGNSYLSPTEYLRYLNSESCRLNESEVLNKIKFNCKLQPSEVITLLNGNCQYENLKAFEEDKQQYNNQLNFILIIEDENANEHNVKETVFDKEVYSQLLSYANTELQNDFKLELSDGHIIPCSMVHIEPANSIYPVIRIAGVFYNVSAKVRDYKILFDDHIFNNGKIKFHYEKEIFDKLPHLNL